MPRSKYLPNLSEYLDTRDAKVKSPQGERMSNVAFWVAWPIISTIGYFGLDRITSLSQGACVAIAVFAIGLTLSIAIAGGVLENANQKERAAHKRLASSEDVHGMLKKAQAESKLHKNIDANAAALLEESARQWLRIHSALNGPIWTSSDLPEHWLKMKDQLRGAANQAMDDVLLLLRSSYNKQPKSSDWQTSVADFLETFFGVPTEQEPGYLPPEFESARTTAQKLVELAVQVEETAKRMARDKSVHQEYSSTTAIDLALSNLKDIHTAESELRQQLNQ